MSCLVISKASILYGWDDSQEVDPTLDLGNGYVIHVADPNVPTNTYADDLAISQKMKDFMSNVSFKVIK